MVDTLDTLDIEIKTIFYKKSLENSLDSLSSVTLCPRRELENHVKLPPYGPAPAQKSASTGSLLLILNDLCSILFNSRTRSYCILLIINDLYSTLLKSHESVLS
jgi:hypothetical protein